MQELKATSVVAVNIETASTKIRTGGPVDDPADLDLPVWSGVVPIRQIAEAVLPDDNEKAELETPDYVEVWRQQFNSES